MEWIREKHDQGLITLPDVVQTGPNRIRDTATARRLIAVLVQHRYLRQVGPKTVHGKPRRDVWKLLEFEGALAKPAKPLKQPLAD